MTMDVVVKEDSPYIEIDQLDPLVDDLIHIRVLGLIPGSRVTILATLKEKGQEFGSSACFSADDNGTVDVSQQPSLDGTYTGVHQMGLFWSMKPAPYEPQWIRLFKRDASTPLVTTITVYKGTIDFEELYSTQHTPLVSKTINRWYMGKGIQKITVKHGRLRGSLFVPSGTGPFPGVIDLFGTAGALAEFRAALLASRGFVAYALPYYGLEGLPENLASVEFEYFVEAVNWLSSRPYVDANGIGVIGVSKGGEIALQMAYYIPQIKAAVSINGLPFLSGIPMSYQGTSIGLSNFDMDAIYMTPEGKSYREVYICEPEDYIPLYKKETHVLLVVGENDLCVDPHYLKLFYQTYPQNRRHLVQLCLYEGAGHLIEPPHTPLTRSSRRYQNAVPGFPDPEYVLWGGYPVQHAAAQEQSWAKILDFFRVKLQHFSMASNL